MQEVCMPLDRTDLQVIAVAFCTHLALIQVVERARNRWLKRKSRAPCAA